MRVVYHTIPKTCPYYIQVKLAEIPFADFQFCGGVFVFGGGRGGRGGVKLPAGN